MKAQIRKCRKCGKPVSVITWGVYRKVLVDAEAVNVVPDPEGFEFIRIDGSKVRGIPMEIFEPLQYDLNPSEFEYVYRPHRCGR